MWMDLKILWIFLISVRAEEKNIIKTDVLMDPYESTDELGTSDGESRYLINTSGCRIPWFRVDHQDKLNDDTCGDRQVLVRKVADDQIHFTMLKRFDYCCYNYYRILSSREYEVSATCIPFKNDTTIIFLHEFISVRCKKPKETYKDYYAFVKKVEEVKDKTDQSWNVIILGMDNMSRTHSHSSLKSTVAFMQGNQWLEYQGFNKVGESTAANLIPLLTGKQFLDSESLISNTSAWLSSDCNSDTYNCNSHIIWHQYQKYGYATAFGEDSVYTTSIFQSRGWHGFLNPPTHHFLSPFFKIGEKYTRSLICTGQITSAAQILSYAEDFVKTYRQKKFFGFFWISSHSHDTKHLNMEVLNFFKNLYSLGIQKNTFVIFMGDHGMQQVPAKLGIQGFYETKLPMFFMLTPMLFQDFYPTQYSNLILNQKRLVSPYDIHITLQNILNISDDSFIMRTADGCPKCKSLFQEIPDNRSCSDAGIAHLFCSCHEMKKTSVYEYGAMYSILKAYEHTRYMLMQIPQTNIFSSVWCTVVLRIHIYREGLGSYYVVALRETSKGLVYEVIVQKTVGNDSHVYSILSWQELNGLQYCTDGICMRTRHGGTKFRVCEQFKI